MNLIFFFYFICFNIVYPRNIEYGFSFEDVVNASLSFFLPCHPYITLFSIQQYYALFNHLYLLLFQQNKKIVFMITKYNSPKMTDLNIGRVLEQNTYDESEGTYATFISGPQIICSSGSKMYYVVMWII